MCVGNRLIDVQRAVMMGNFEFVAAAVEIFCWRLMHACDAIESSSKNKDESNICAWRMYA